jgi:hypothetical protein
VCLVVLCCVRQVITTPVGTSFDQLRAADEVQYKFDRCCKALEVCEGGGGGGARAARGGGMAAST